LDKPYYLEKLRFFEQQTEFLLGWIKSNDKFKMAEKGGFWAWLKNTQKHVKVDFMQKIQDFKEKPNEHDETFHCAEEVSKGHDHYCMAVGGLGQMVIKRLLVRTSSNQKGIELSRWGWEA
jgi:hypothetical protein